MMVVGAAMEMMPNTIGAAMGILLGHSRVAISRRCVGRVAIVDSNIVFCHGQRHASTHVRGITPPDNGVLYIRSVPISISSNVVRLNTLSSLNREFFTNNFVVFPRESLRVKGHCKRSRLSFVQHFPVFCRQSDTKQSSVYRGGVIDRTCPKTRFSAAAR